MPQVEEGTTASDFVANTTGSPKFITGPTFGPRVPMILVEPSATNLVSYSEDFSNSSWGKSAAGTGVAPAVTLNAAESPDGTQNATKVVFDSGSGTSSGDLSLFEDFFNATSGISYTQSVYLKGENGGEKILLRNAGNSAYTTVTLTTDWARYEVTETANLNFGYFSMGLRQAVNGSINSQITVYAYGAQVESGSVATSYIPTSGSTVTRAADDLVISGSDFSDFYNQSEGTVYAEVVTRGYDGYFLSINDGTTTNRIVFKASSANFFVSVGGAIQNNLTYTPYPVSGSLYRRAGSYKANNFLLSNNGAAIISNTSGLVPSSVTQIRIGKGTSVGTHLNGHIKRLIYWPYHSDSL